MSWLPRIVSRPIILVRGPDQYLGRLLSIFWVGLIVELSVGRILPGDDQ